MTDDLVQRLRRTYRKEFPVTGSMIADNSNRLRPFPILAAEVPFNPDGHEAADRIEALQAEKEQWQVYYNETVRDNFQLLCENVRLSAALAEQVEACFCPDCEMCFRHKQLLKETDETFTHPDNV